MKLIQAIPLILSIIQTVIADTDPSQDEELARQLDDVAVLKGLAERLDYAVFLALIKIARIVRGEL